MTSKLWQAFSINNDSMKQQCKTQGMISLLTFVALFTLDCAGMRQGVSVADSWPASQDILLVMWLVAPSQLLTAGSLAVWILESRRGAPVVAPDVTLHGCGTTECLQ